MKRVIITVGAALLAAVPATVGFIGNASFSQSVPVRVPSQSVVVDDNGGQRATAKHIEPGDDNGGVHKHIEPGDDNGGQRATAKHIEPGDDNGGQRATAKHIEPGDDNGGQRATGKHIEPGDDNGGSGRDRSGKGGGDDGSKHS